MLTPDNLDRVAKILIDAGEASSYAEAQSKLARYAMRVWISNDCIRTPAGQAALLTMVATGYRALPGGVFVEAELDVPLNVGTYTVGSLRELILHIGGRVDHRGPTDSPIVRIGTSQNKSQSGVPIIDCVYRGWRGGVLPGDLDEPQRPDTNAITPAAILAGAISVSEVFQFHRGGMAEAARRSTGLSLWRPDQIENWKEEDDSEPRISFLPNSLWLIGLGHLGQAYLWVLGLLPYAQPQDVELVLQDFDRLTISNTSTSVLTTPSIIGQLKTRAMATWAESRGFQAHLFERRFADNIRVVEGDPAICLCGVDNSVARAALGDAGFRMVVNAGLGAGPVEFMAMRLYTFPGPKSPRTIWGTSRKSSVALPLDRPAYTVLREAGFDECGLTLLAERTVGAPFVGVSAATLVISEVLRAVHGGKRVIACDATLAALAHRKVVLGEAQKIGNPGFTDAMP